MICLSLREVMQIARLTADRLLFENENIKETS